MNRVHSKKFIWLAVTLVAISGIGFFVFRTFNPSIGFTYYEPSYLPSNVTVKAKRVSLNKYAPTQVEQNLRTEDWVYSIREYKASESIGSAQQNYNERSIEPTCSLLTSPEKFEYRLCHWIDYGTIGVQEVKFIKETTFINAQIPTKVDEPISIEEIGKFVDSFEKRSTIGLPVLRSSGA